MAGTYIEGQSKTLSGVYTLIKAAISVISLGARGVVAFPFVSNWGPVNQLKNVGGYANDFDDLYNAAATQLSANKIYKLAFLGSPREVLAYRMATGLAAVGTCTLKDASNADSIVMATKYPSDRAFTAVVKDGLVGGTKIIDIMEGTVKLCTVEDATIAGLVAKLNATDYVTVTSSGTTLPKTTAGNNFAGGNNGDVATITEYTAFMDELEADGTANAFALDGVVDDTILASAYAWLTRVRQDGLYVDFVRGGAAAWDSDGGAAANTKSISLNHRGVINVGNGVDGYTAADMAIFVAARAGSIALNRTLTDEPLSGFTAVNKKLKPAERIACKNSGTLVFVQDGERVLIDEGVNTLTAPTGDETVEFAKIRVSNTLDYISKDLEAFGKEYKRTRSNTEAARETFAATVESDYLAPLEYLEVLQPGSFYVPDPEYHGKDAKFTPKLDEAYFYSNITPVDSMEKIYQKIGVQF